MFIKLIFMHNLMLFSFVSLAYGFNNQKYGLCFRGLFSKLCQVEVLFVMQS